MTEILSRNNTESISYPLILNNNRGKDSNNISKPTKIKKRQNLILKKSNSLNYITNTNEINNSKTIEIINSINLAKNKKNNKMNLKNNSYALDLFSKHRAIDNESLQMNNRQLKTEINKIKRILTNIKKKNSEKDNEISKQEVLIGCPSLGRSSVESALKKLVEDGTLIRIGAGRKTLYARADSIEE